MDKIAVVILAGGSGKRFNHELPKQFVKLAGKPVIIHTIGVFLQSNSVDHIVLVVPHKYILYTCQLLEDYFIPKEKVIITEGGATRQESSYKGLIHCPTGTDYVLIHDAVRPLLGTKLIKTLVERVKKEKAVDTCIPSYDTIVETKGDYINSIPDRKKLLRGQTPQAFDYQLILKAHEWARRNNICDFTDDCGIALARGRKIYVETGEEKNIKITSVNDIYIAERLFQNGESISLGKSTNKKWYIGKKILVLGGSGAIGGAVIKELKNNKCLIIAASRSTKVPIDVRNEKEIVLYFDKIVKKYSLFDGIIYSVGKMVRKPIKETTVTDWCNIFNANLKGAFLVMKHLDRVLNNKGHVLFVGSSSYSLGRGGYAAYSSSKSALINLVQGVAVEQPEYYINVVSPQRVATPLRFKNFQEKIGLEGLLDLNKVAKEIVNILPSEVSGLNYDIRNSI